MMSVHLFDNLCTTKKSLSARLRGDFVMAGVLFTVSESYQKEPISHDVCIYYHLLILYLKCSASSSRNN